MSKKAGLIFPVARVRKQLKVNKYSNRLGVAAPIYLAAVLEYLCAEVLDISVNAARDNKCKRITPRHIMLAARNDHELNTFLGRGVHISQGGSLPSIHSVLLPKKKTPKTDEEKAAARDARDCEKHKRDEARMAKKAAKQLQHKVAKSVAQKAAKGVAAKGASKSVAKSAAKGISTVKSGSSEAKKGKTAASSAPILVTRDDDEPDEPDYDSETGSNAEVLLTK